MTSNIDKIKKIANHLKVLHGGKHVSEEERLRLKKQAEEQPRDELGRFIATDPRAQWQDEQPIVSGEEKELPSQSASSLEEIERELGLRKSDSKSVAEEIKKQAGHQILEHGQVPASIPAAASEVDLLKHYKRNNHSKDATLLRYLVHRIENVDQYQTSQGGKDADADFMKRSGEALNLAHREARHFEEQPTIHQLHHFTRQHPHVIQGLIDQQKKLHDHLQSKQSQVTSGLSSQQYIKNINGEPHIALNRGLKRGVRKPDPSIASYSDSKESLGGRCEVHHPHWVPLKNVWYSYDLGPKEAHPQRYFPAQDEYIVSPHELKSASAHDVKKLIPAKQPKMERKVASESLCAESLAKESSFLSATKGTFAHPTKAVKTATQPNAPKDIPHIRADSQTEVNFRLEKDDKKEQVVKSLNKSGPVKEGQHFVDFPEFDSNRQKVTGAHATWHFSKRDLAHILRNWDNAAHWEWRGAFKYAPDANKAHPSVRQRQDAPVPIKDHVKGQPQKVNDILYHGAGVDMAGYQMLHDVGKQVDAHDPFQAYGDPKDPWKRDIRPLPNKKYDQIHSVFTLNVVTKPQGKQILQDMHDRMNDDGKAIISVRRDEICAKNAKPKLVENSGKPLKKAFSAKHWNPIDRANYQNGQNIIDFAGQSAMTNPADKEYVDAATKPEIEPVVKQNFMLKGISPKIIHNTGDKTTSYMTKPYYRAPDEGGASSPLPIMGWATATNHALYQAGNIGNLCEKIQTHVHNGTPVTVHPFERDYQDAGSIDRYHMPSRLPVHLHLPYQQIAMMDFLTHNTDRHSGNFMVKKGRTQLGQDHKQDLTPLAIDHERSFQYLDRQISHPADSIMKLLQHTMGDYDNAKATVSGMDMKPLAQWWNTNKDRIIDTFHKHAAHIKHDSVRKHVTDHFMARAGMLNDWARHDKSHTLYDGRDLTYEMDMGDDNEFKFKGVFKEKKKRPTELGIMGRLEEFAQVHRAEFQGNPVRPLKERKMKVAGLLEKKPVVDKVKKKPAVDKKVKKA